MKLGTLDYKQTIPVSIDEAWKFFVDPHNLKRITPPELGLVVTSDTEGRTYAGQIITYSVTPFFNFPVSWVTEITHVQEPRLFVDEQRFGPYRFWHHQHLLLEDPSGGTVVRDLVNYALPMQPISSLILGRFVARKLNYIFEYRATALKKIFP